MVNRATLTCSNNTVPSRTKAIAECSSCVLPRSARSCASAARTIGRFGKALAAQRQNLIGAERQTAGIERRDRGRFLARQKGSNRRRDLRRRAVSECAFIEIGRMHFDQTPAADSSCLRMLLREASTSGCSASHNTCAHDARLRRRSPRWASTAAAVSSIERRVTSISGQLCLAQSRREAAISSVTAWRSIYWSSSRCALRPSSRFCRICTMRSGVANNPTTSGWSAARHAAAKARPAPKAHSPS